MSSTRRWRRSRKLRCRCPRSRTARRRRPMSSGNKTGQSCTHTLRTVLRRNRHCLVEGCSRYQLAVALSACTGREHHNRSLRRRCLRRLDPRWLHSRARRLRTRRLRTPGPANTPRPSCSCSSQMLRSGNHRSAHTPNWPGLRSQGPIGFRSRMNPPGKRTPRSRDPRSHCPTPGYSRFEEAGMRGHTLSPRQRRARPSWYHSMSCQRRTRRPLPKRI